MTKIDSNKVIRFLQERWQGRVCPMCLKGHWSVSEQVFEMREFNGGGLIIGGNSSIIPVIPVTCNNCGNIVYINAIVAGFVGNDGKANNG